jgi:hypothetical protein
MRSHPRRETRCCPTVLQCAMSWVCRPGGALMVYGATDRIFVGYDDPRVKARCGDHTTGQCRKSVPWVLLEWNPYAGGKAPSGVHVLLLNV